MPHGKGTYGSKVGRPAKKSPMNKNGDPKKKIKSAGKFQSRAEARENTCRNARSRRYIR